MASAIYFRQKAEQCRRLARGVLNSKDPAVASLLALAGEFDARAAALEAETAAAVAIGYGDDIGDLQAKVNDKEAMAAPSSGNGNGRPN